nr:rhomboid family intramembrane serine protease [Pseudenhygromyxa sp. WMMC2535]
MLLGDRGFAAALSLEPASLLQGQRWWSPLTALFRYPEGLGLLGLLWTLIVQWWIGSRLEGFWGTTRYLVMVLVAGLVGYGGVAALALALPAFASLTFSGATPMDAAAILAFAVVFARERMKLGSREVAPGLVAGIAGLVVLAFPLVAALVSGATLAAAWPVSIPPLLAALVAVLFVQPWRKRGSSGKVERSKVRGASHLRVVRTADDMLN